MNKKIAIMLMLIMSSANAYALEIEKLASAIKAAENSKSHPYGIMRPYCGPNSEAQCRKGCIQTIQKRLRLFQSEDLPQNDKSFIEYLSRSYAPLNAKNDPSGLNKNWVRNVSWFYFRR